MVVVVVRSERQILEEVLSRLFGLTKVNSCCSNNSNTVSGVLEEAPGFIRLRVEGF